MAALKSIFNKNRVYDATPNHWIEFADSLESRKVLRFRGAVHGDTTRLETNSDVWSIKFKGTFTTLDFGKFDDFLGKVMKWAIVKILSENTVATGISFFHAYVRCISTYEDILLPRLVTQIKVHAVKNHDSNFYSLRRLAEYLIDAGAPNTDIEDRYEIEQLACPKRNYHSGIYDSLERFSDLEKRFMETRSLRDFRHLESLSYVELRGLILLRVAYEIGLRPIQLFKLCRDHFENINDKYFSLKRPWAKQRKGRKLEGLDKLAISPELGRAISHLIKRQSISLSQLFQHEDGSSCATDNFNRYIRATIQRWGANGEGRTIYDFRHNLGHSLAMSGADASQIAFMMGHRGSSTAKHYISASPNIAYIREKALGENATYGKVIALLTGELTLEKDWKGEKVIGVLGSQLITGIGGCGTSECQYNPVYSCYGCEDFCPFKDGNHQQVLVELKREAKEVVDVSDRFNQTSINPAITQLTGTMEEVEMVIARCELACHEA